MAPKTITCVRCETTRPAGARCPGCVADDAREHARCGQCDRRAEQCECIDLCPVCGEETCEGHSECPF